MKIHEKVRNLYADLARLSDHFEEILGLSRKKIKSAQLKKMLEESLTDSLSADTTITNAMKVNQYAIKHRSEVRKLAKKNRLDEIFFQVASKVFEKQEAVDTFNSIMAILTELSVTVKTQRATIKDLTHVEAEEFSHLKEWGLKHNIGKKKRIHITDFAHKLEKQIKWKHDDEENNSRVIEKLVEKEPDRWQRSVHLYIISLVKLKHFYDDLEKRLAAEEKRVTEQEKTVKTLREIDIHSTKFDDFQKTALDKAEQLREDIISEGHYLKDLITELKEAESCIPDMKMHRKTIKGAFLLNEGHPIQIDDYYDRHPEKINLEHLFKTKETTTLILGSSHDFCHINISHASPVHARLAMKKGRFYLFNEKGSPGTFIIRKKQPISIVQDKEDMKILVSRMAMPGNYDYKDIIRKKKLTFKLIPPEKFIFPLEDQDLIIIPPGYKFRVSLKT